MLEDKYDTLKVEWENNILKKLKAQKILRKKKTNMHLSILIRA